MADSTQNNYTDHCSLSKVKIYMTHEFPLPPIMWMSQKILEARERDHRPIKIFCPHIHMHKAMSISTRSSASAVKCIKVIQKGTRKNLWTSIHSSFQKYLWYKIIQYQLQHPKTKFFKTEKEAKLFSGHTEIIRTLWSSENVMVHSSSRRFLRLLFAIKMYLWTEWTGNRRTVWP